MSNDFPPFASGGDTCQELGILVPSPTETHPVSGCVLLDIDTSDWETFSAIYRPDLSNFSNIQPNNPIFQVHDVQSDDTVCVDLQMFTEAGDGWRGRTGQYPLHCQSHGLCFAVWPDGRAVTAEEGTITIDTFPTIPTVEGRPYSLVIENARLGELGGECYFLERLELEGVFSDLSGTS